VHTNLNHAYVITSVQTIRGKHVCTLGFLQYMSTYFLEQFNSDMRWMRGRREKKEDIIWHRTRQVMSQSLLSMISFLILWIESITSVILFNYGAINNNSHLPRFWLFSLTPRKISQMTQENTTVLQWESKMWWRLAALKLYMFNRCSTKSTLDCCMKMI